MKKKSKQTSPLRLVDILRRAAVAQYGSVWKFARAQTCASTHTCLRWFAGKQNASSRLVQKWMDLLGVTLDVDEASDLPKVRAVVPTLPQGQPGALFGIVADNQNHEMEQGGSN